MPATDEGRSFPPTRGRLAVADDDGFSRDKERRVVTLLFADLVDSTGLGEVLDPEELEETIGRTHAILIETVRARGGHIIKLLGDGLLACFGAPIAREDDAERAVLAGLQMQRALKNADLHLPAGTPPLQLRVGITSGEVLAAMMDGVYDVVGDAANTAARLQTAADAGGVLVGAETMRLAERRIRFGERRDLQLKGKAGVVAGYPALDVRERRIERWEVGKKVPLVGRQRELGILLAAWGRALTGEGTLVSLGAEAGTGKSRLVMEAVGQMGGAARILTGHCLSYGTGVSLGLIADLLRNVCGITDGDPEDIIRTHLADTVLRLLGERGMEEVEAAIDVLGSILGLPTGGSNLAEASPEIRRRNVERTLLHITEALGRQGPLILVLEDLHWSDEGSLEVLREILPELRQQPLLILATHRTGWEPPWAAWDWVTLLTLTELDAGDALQLARSALGNRPLAPDLERRLFDRAGGNPFFVEQLVRSLQESHDIQEIGGRLSLVPGAADRLPWSLADVLMARVDRLDRSARSTGQTASVIGRSFGVRLLEGLSGQDEEALEAPLRALRSAEIAVPDGEDGPDYLFRHALLWEAIYGTVLLRRRRDLHGRTARAILELYGEEQVDSIAYHYSRTQEHAECARWTERAGDRAASLYANEDALARYGEARERLGKAGAGPADAARINTKMGGVLKTIGRYDEALETLDLAIQGYRDAGDREGERRAVAEIGRVHRAHGTPDAGIARVTAVLDADPDAPPTSGVAALHVVLARLYFNLGRYQDQLQAAGSGSKLASEIGDRRVLAEAEMSRSIALYLLGRTETALAAMQAAVPIAEEVGDFDVLNNLVGNIALIYRDMGDFEQSRRYRERSVVVTERMGDMANHSFALASLGEVMFFLGDWAGAERNLNRALDIIRSLSTSWFSSQPPLVLGHLYAARGDFAGAIRWLEEALAIAAKGGFRHSVRRVVDCLAEIDVMQGNPEAALARFGGTVNFDALDENDSSLTETLPIAAWARLESGDVDEALLLAERAQERAVQEHAIVELLAAQRVRGMILAAQSEWETALGALEETIGLARHIQYPYALARALYEQGRVLTRMGEDARAMSSLREAFVLFQQLGAERYAALAGAALGLPVA